MFSYYLCVSSLTKNSAQNAVRYGSASESLVAGLVQFADIQAKDVNGGMLLIEGDINVRYNS